MKRIYYHFFTILTILCVACNDHSPMTNADFTSSGVSWQLAQWRKEHISELHYDLNFYIPASRTESVTGKVTISFEAKNSDDIIIDFRQTQEHISTIRANGNICDIILQNEHIIIPATHILEGENHIAIEFTAGDQSINRNDEFLYTLLVPDRARTLFPCFDQPNLKAHFKLSLDIPEEWQAVSNTSIVEQHYLQGRRHISFGTTEPLSTYLFSFVAGDLDSRTYDDGTHRFTAYYRETDPRRLAQLDTIFAQVAASLEWLEEYTGIEYPFAKYDLIILPGFQYGGMEHTGATLYNDTQMFLGEHPTLDEQLRRIELIAHETAHMWFGDYVTMAWFDDVWTKEVFANYFAARITEPLFPDINHRLNFMKNYVQRALSEDRTLGTTSIRQPLDNLQNAGLIYGNIIYNKAPVMMEKLVEIMGEENFRKGIREYLREYAYDNATWEDLIAILDRWSDADLAAFSDVWVNQKAMPHIYLSANGKTLNIEQRDPYNRDIVWPQSFACGIIDKQGCYTTAEITLYGRNTSIELPTDIAFTLPNVDGRGYGLFIADDNSRRWIMDNWHTISDDTAREALAMVLKENYEIRAITDREWLDMLIRGIECERNPLIISTLCSYLAEPLRALECDREQEYLLDMANRHPVTSCRQQLIRTLCSCATSTTVTDALYDIWHKANHRLLSIGDYMNLAYELSLRYPERYDYIVEVQQSRISNNDRRRQFDYIIRGASPDIDTQRQLFEEVLKAENRSIEPWAATLLSLLNHPLREAHAVEYITPALNELTEVQRTGDIFFPRNWAGAALGNHRSIEAYREVERFFEANPEYHPLLKNKILQAAHPLYRLHGRQK